MSLLWTIALATPAVAAEPVAGSGSTWAANAVERWAYDFYQQSGTQVSFSAVGSASGRAQFRDGQSGFAVSDIGYLPDDNGILDPPPTDRGFTYLPVVGGGLALAYNLRVGGMQVFNLRLSGDTLAKIFTGVITSWDDPAIRADNPTLQLPAQTIVPVVRGDRSATSKLLSRWLADRHPGTWAGYCARAGLPSCAPTAAYPVVPGMISQTGSDRVAGYVAQPANTGAITYVEYSYATARALPVVNLRNEAGAYVGPTADAVSIALRTAGIRPDQTQDLVPVFASQDPNAYPLSSYTYAIVPTDTRLDFTPAEGETLAAFLRYAVGPGQSHADQVPVR